MRLSKALDHFSTIKDFSEAIGVAASTVAEWKRKGGQIPAKYVPVTKAAIETTKPQIDEPLCFDKAMVMFGTVQRIAEVFDVHPNTAYNWKSAGYIPANSARKLGAIKT